MSAFSLLVKLRVAEVARKRSSLAFFLILPVILLVTIGLVFMNGHPFERHRVAVVHLDPDARSTCDELAKRPEVRLSDEPDEDTAMAKLSSREVSAVIVLMPFGQHARVIVADDQEIIGRGLLAHLPSSTSLTTTKTPHWGYVHYLFPGLLTFAVMLSGLFGMGYFLVRHRQNLFLKKLATTPLPKHTFIAAQIVARALLVLGQMAVLVVIAWLVFALPIRLVALPWVAALTVLGVLVFMGAGFALACVIKTEATMVDVINAITTPLVLLSEIFFPIDELPRPIAAVGGALPTTQLVRLLRAVILHHVTDPRALLPGIAIVCAWLVVTFGVSTFAFRWHD